MHFHLYSNFEKSEEEALRDRLGPLEEIFPMLKVKLFAREGKFGPEIINEVSKEFGGPTNNIFIGAPEEKHIFSIKDFFLGGGQSHFLRPASPQFDTLASLILYFDSSKSSSSKTLWSFLELFSQAG